MSSDGFTQVAQKSLKIEDDFRLKYSFYKSAHGKRKEPKLLVIALHWGWGQDELVPYYSKIFLENFILPICINENVIIIAPDCPADSWTKEKSTLSVIKLRDYCINKYKIDTNNIVLTGFSLGGIGTWYLALHYPELFPYAIPIAGYAETSWYNKEKTPNIYAVNSFNDQIIPYQKIEQFIEFIGEDDKIKFKIIYGIEHYNTSRFIKPTREILNDFLKNE